MRKIMALALAITLVLTLCACSNNEASTISSSQSISATSTASEQEPEAVDTTPQEVISVPDTSVESAQEEVASEEVPPEEDPRIPITCGESIETDKFIMSFEWVAILPELKFQTSEYSSTSLYVEDGCQLLVVKGHFTNMHNTAIDSYAFSFDTLVNGEYQFDDAQLDFVSNASFEIDPLADLDFYLHVNIPQRLVDMYEYAEFTIAYKDDLSFISTIWNADGTTELDADTYYLLTTNTAAQAESASETAAQEPSPDTSEKDTDTSTPIALGQTIVTNEYEFTLNNVELLYELKPSNTTSFYTSYEAPSGKIYVHVDGTYYNTSKRDICIRDLPIPTADYDDGYVYEGFPIVDKDDNSFTWVSSYVVATPLSTCHYHGLIECPEVIADDTGSLYVLLPLADGITYRYDIS